MAITQRQPITETRIEDGQASAWLRGAASRLRTDHTPDGGIVGKRVAGPRQVAVACGLLSGAAVLHRIHAVDVGAVVDGAWTDWILAITVAVGVWWFSDRRGPPPGLRVLSVLRAPAAPTPTTVTAGSALGTVGTGAAAFGAVLAYGVLVPAIYAERTPGETAVVATVLGVALLLEWAIVRAIERSRGAEAVLVPSRQDEDDDIVVMVQPDPLMRAFGR